VSDRGQQAEPVVDVRELIDGAQKHIGRGTDLVHRLYNGERPTDTELGDWMQYSMTYMQIAFQTPCRKGRPPISNAKHFAAWRAAQPEPREVQPLTDEQIDAVVPWGKVLPGFYSYAGYTRNDLYAAVRACATTWGLKLAGSE
jgi:hypothetical protein